MGKATNWYDQARCHELGLSVDDFIPPVGKEPTAEARRACMVCPVADQCLKARGRDEGLRAGIFFPAPTTQALPPVTLRCDRCRTTFKAPSTTYRYCATCRPLARYQRGA